jgi:hypothetical protein
MKQNLKNGGSGGNDSTGSPSRAKSRDRIFGRLAAEKKKTAIAVCLITVMFFMWVKVLGRKGPQSASAAVVAQEVNEGQVNSELKISFMELPKVEGRNDVLTRDFFAVSSWRDFMRGGEGKSGGEEVSVVSRNGGEETARRVAEKLKLEAIVLGENPRAFINDKLLSVGDKLFVKDGTNTCECEVAKIEENMVFIRCGEAEVTLRLTQTSIIDY